MRDLSCDVLIVGGGTGGTAAALAARSLGLHVILSEETAWFGGQLTSQAVPPDEHPWIEQFGCTRRYRRYRDEVRARTAVRGLNVEAFHLNPGGGWVSNLCHEPELGAGILREWLQGVDVLQGYVPTAADVEGDFVRGVVLLETGTGDRVLVRAKYFLDATELGDLLPLSGAEYVVGAESRDETGEPHAAATASGENVQALTWCFAMAHDPGSHRVIDKPVRYDFWRTFRPSFWPGPLLGEQDLNPVTGESRTMPFWSSEGWSWFNYRQIYDPSIYREPPFPHPVTIVNWPMNDYFLDTIIDVPAEVKEERLLDAKELGLSLLYELQTEMDLPGLYMAPSFVGTEDGFALSPYIRESRRIVSRFTILEQHVCAAINPRWDRATEFADSVGVGAYRIDLHPSTGGDGYIDLSTLPFQIPLGSLVPQRVRNLLPACKNIGSTHLTNGCYRLHPVEWNIGESAGLLAGFCRERGVEPSMVLESASLVQEFQALLHAQGIETQWPRLHPL